MVSKRDNEIWTTTVYKLADEPTDRYRYTYGRTAEDCAASRNDFIRYTPRPNGTRRPYVAGEVTVLGGVDYPYKLLKLVQEIQENVPTARLLRVLSAVLLLVQDAGGPDPYVNADLDNNTGWQNLLADLQLG